MHTYTYEFLPPSTLSPNKPGTVITVPGGTNRARPHEVPCGRQCARSPTDTLPPTDTDWDKNRASKVSTAFKGFHFMTGERQLPIFADGIYFGLRASASRLCFKGSLLVLKWQLQLCEILWAESISFEWFEVFLPLHVWGGEAREASWWLVHKVRAGEQQNPEAEPQGSLQSWWSPAETWLIPLVEHIVHMLCIPACSSGCFSM